MSEPEKVEKRAAIVGTAQTWVLTPWQDPGLDIFSLNDAYALGWRKGWDGLPRASGWVDLHPFHQMSFRPREQKVVNALDVPMGAYLRPEGHLEWLRTRKFPVYVNEKPAHWPEHVKTFPRKELEAKYGTYFASTPAWMVALLMEQGYTQIEVYGIHLATEWEYVQQKPNMEFWLARAIERGIKIVLPTKCPLLKSKHVYAYEPKPDLPLQQVQQQIALLKHEGAGLQQRLAKLRWYERGEKADLIARLDVLQSELTDVRHHQRRLATVIHAA